VAELRLRLLGGLVVEGLRPAEVGSRKARRLLAALAVPPRRPVRTDALLEVLWGDDLPSRPADQLGVLVSRLRGALGGEHVIRTDAGYRLASYWVDAEELTIRAGAARAHLLAGDGLTARLAATMALDLARGPLLPEEDGAWFDAPRAAASRAVGEAGLVAAEAALLVGDPLGACAAASLAIDHDPYDEAALRVLMRAHVAAGRPASALAAYADMRTRLREDLGVSPDASTEALHDDVLGSDTATAPVRVDGWDPLVQRARAELANNDVTGAWRDAQEAVRRGGGPGALELAGWTAYYARDFPAALRWAEEAAARTEEPERRASSLSLAARILHSTGHLAAAETRLGEAVRSDVPGVRAMAEVWLGLLRVHQGRASEAIELVARGSIDAAALRHPFVMSHSQFSRVLALGAQGRAADALTQLDEWDRTLGELGPVGDRYQPAALNCRGWVLSAIGQRDEAERCHERAHDLANTLQEPRVHALLDLARSALDAGDLDLARERLASVLIPPEEEGTMVWHQRQRAGILRALLALQEGRGADARRDAEAVEGEARDLGAGRHEVQAAAVVLEARLLEGSDVSDDEVRRLLQRLAPLAGLERWRTAARLGAASNRPWLWEQAGAWASELAAASGSHGPQVAAYTEAELARLGGPG
jgi:DNA-binding SARP family transcriptional activator/predicted negative regulator of RcsB-dependent stress response